MKQACKCTPGKPDSKKRHEAWYKHPESKGKDPTRWFKKKDHPGKKELGKVFVCFDWGHKEASKVDLQGADDLITALNKVGKQYSLI